VQEWTHSSKPHSTQTDLQAPVSGNSTVSSTQLDSHQLSDLVVDASDVANCVISFKVHLEACWACIPEDEADDIDTGIVSIWQVRLRLAW
jgi:hypothetical protein